MLCFATVLTVPTVLINPSGALIKAHSPLASGAKTLQAASKTKSSNQLLGNTHHHHEIKLDMPNFAKRAQFFIFVLSSSSVSDLSLYTAR